MASKSSGSADRTAPVPRGTRRRQQIITVAERVFLASGFSDTKMQDVATEAGASKETLYRHFGSKEELFAEVVDNRARSLREQLDIAIKHPRALNEVLHDLGIKLLQTMTSPEIVAFLRMVVAETPRDPKLGRMFYAVGPGQTLDKLAEFLSVAQGRNDFKGRDASLAAGIFVGAVMSQIHMQCLLLEGVPQLSATEIERRVGEVVAMFASRYLRRDAT